MNKKVIWAIVILVLVAVGIYAGYWWNSKQTAKTVEGLLNQSQARLSQCLGHEVGAQDSCPGGTTSAGGYTFCWSAGGLGISCYSR